MNLSSTFCNVLVSDIGEQIVKGRLGILDKTKASGCKNVVERFIKLEVDKININQTSDINKTSRSLQN